jgi:hypothetical protein
MGTCRLGSMHHFYLFGSLISLRIMFLQKITVNMFFTESYFNQYVAFI